MTIIQTFDTSDEPANPLTKRLTLTAGILVLGLVIIKIWINNVMVEYGRELEKVTVSQKSLRVENQILQNEVYTLSTLSKISTRSSELGFSSPQHLQYIRAD